MTLIIDYREKKDMRNYLKLKGLDFETQNLTTGDYYFERKEDPKIRVLVEKKSIGDLIGSYFDGRMESQFKRMSEEIFGILLITGNIKDITYKHKKKFDKDFVQQVMAKAVIQYNFKSVIWIMEGVYNVERDGLYFILNVLNDLVNNKLDTMPTKRKRKIGDPRIEIVKTLFCVNNTVAIAMLKKFGTIRTIMDANQKDLISIPGVGVTISSKIRNILDESFQ